jgi:two-component SAPR family response regulator
MEYKRQEYNKIKNLDSKQKTKEKLEIFEAEMCKEMRTVDPLGNPHAESIIHSLMNMSDLAMRAIYAAFEHVNEMELSTLKK